MAGIQQSNGGITMKNEKTIIAAEKVDSADENIFSEKARTYVVCLSETCSRRDNCLRRRVADAASTSLRLFSCVNPRWDKAGSDDCPMYRSAAKVLMARGMMHLFDDLPYAIVKSIRKQLIAHFSRKPFYDMRKGVRLINPDAQQYIADVMQRHGVTTSPRFDSFEEVYWW